MALKEKLQNDLTAALRARDEVRSGTLLYFQKVGLGIFPLQVTL